MPKPCATSFAIPQPSYPVLCLCHPLPSYANAGLSSPTARQCKAPAYDRRWAARRCGAEPVPGQQCCAYGLLGRATHCRSAAGLDRGKGMQFRSADTQCPRPALLWRRPTKLCRRRRQRDVAPAKQSGAVPVLHRTVLCRGAAEQRLALPQQSHAEPRRCVAWRCDAVARLSSAKAAHRGALPWRLVALPQPCQEEQTCASAWLCRALPWRNVTLPVPLNVEPRTGPRRGALALLCGAVPPLCTAMLCPSPGQRCDALPRPGSAMPLLWMAGA